MVRSTAKVFHLSVHSLLLTTSCIGFFDSKFVFMMFAKKCRYI